MSEFEYLKKHFSDTVFKDTGSKTVSVALDKAYADMSRRANGHSETVKNACKEWLETEFSTLPAKAADPSFDFDDWHCTTCDELTVKLNGAKAGFGTVGRAQKVINMAFKYLSCINGDYDWILPHCHMTLDGYTLAWYKKSVMPWVKKQQEAQKSFLEAKDIVEWSQMTDAEDYRRIQANIREYLKTAPKYSIKIGDKQTKAITLPTVPFEAEFVVWEGEIVKGKYDLLIKELKKYAEKYRGVEAGRTKDAWIAGALFDDYLNEYCKKQLKKKS